MAVLGRISTRFGRERPLRDWSVVLHMHLTDETVTLGACLRAGGAAVWYLPLNRNPAPPRIVEEARASNAGVVADVQELERAVAAAPGRPPRVLVVEENGRFFQLVHQRAHDRPDDAAIARCIAGISEHTAGGGRHVDAYASDDRAAFTVPVVAVYQEPLKSELETGLGTSQSTAAAILRGLGAPLSGRRVLVIGYGNVGKGVARTLAALGACVRVTDIVAERCLAARLVGLAPVELLAGLADAELCVTTTGVSSVLDAGLLERCRDGVRLANVSNKPDEIDLRGCERIARAEPARTLWRTPGGKTVELLGDGLQVNHVVGSGSPASLMDLSFSLHALVLEWLAAEPRPPSRLAVPTAIRERVATLALDA